MAKRRRQFTDGFKKKAVALAATEGWAEALKLGAHRNLIYRWGADKRYAYVPPQSPPPTREKATNGHPPYSEVVVANLFSGVDITRVAEDRDLFRRMTRVLLGVVEKTETV